MAVRSERYDFTNPQGQTLSGRLELPASINPPFALFAHCFTCSKDIAAASRISRALRARGIAVLRFDFTGLGNSEGDFANTNFSSNVDDLVCAAESLADTHAAPQLLIGHSLGGAAVLAAATKLSRVKAVCTIGAPSDPAHIRQHVVSEDDDGGTLISLGGREFRLAGQFVADLDGQRFGGVLSEMKKPLLIFHAIRDEIVGIEHARRIYDAARGSRSFISLDDADHLLSRPGDSEYVAETLAAWATRYLEVPDSMPQPLSVLPGEVRVVERAPGLLNDVYDGRHHLLADEPESVGGTDEGPTPYEYLLASLGACTSITLRMYANRKGWPVDRIGVRLHHDKIHAEDCENCETKEGKLDRIETTVEIEGPLDDAQRQRMLEIAHMCPVHRTLKGEIDIPTVLG